MTPTLIEGIKSIFDLELNYDLENDEDEKFFNDNSKKQRNIPKWSAVIVNTDGNGIVKEVVVIN